MLIARYEDGKRVNKGDTLITFRGEEAEFVMASRPTVPGKSGKVIVRFPGTDYSQEFYVGVVGIARVDFVASPCGHEVCDGFGAENELCRFTDGKFGGRISE